MGGAAEVVAAQWQGGAAEVVRLSDRVVREL